MIEKQEDDWLGKQIDYAVKRYNDFSNVKKKHFKMISEAVYS